MKIFMKRIAAVAAAFLMLVGLLPVDMFGGVKAYAAEKKLNASEIKEATLTADSKVGDFTITAGCAIDASAKTLDNGMEVTKRIKLGGAGAANTKSVKFSTTDAAKVTVYAVSSGDSVRTLALYKDDGSVVGENPAGVAGAIIPESVYEVTEAGNYYLASKGSGINIYYISVAEGQLDPIVRDPWSSVMTPSLTGAASEDGKIMVNYSMKVGSRVADACDQLDITMYDGNGKAVKTEEVAKQGDSGSVEFTPTASGTYTFKAEALRKEESDKKASNEISADFVLPLATPVVRAKTEDANGKMKVIWANVPEAESYDVYMRAAGSDMYELMSNVAASKDAEMSLSKDGFTKGSKYDFSVIAKRGGDESQPGEAKDCTVRNEAERDWIATRFGTSTSDEANHSEGNIYDGLKLYSCTYKDDGTINKKGGKLNASDPYDGITYYYTKIDPKKENFVLTGTFTIDYLNPSPDGQEGFAIIARDSIGKDGDNSSAYYTNSATVIASKVSYTNEDGATKSIKDGIGYRFYTGVTSTTDTPKTGQVYEESGAFDTKLMIKQGESYTFTLKMDNTGFRMIYKDASGKENQWTLYGRDELLVIDKENIYVGFAAARGCNVTVKDIQFTTSDPAKDAPDEGKPVQKVDTNYVISSPSTSGSQSYNMAFSANCDGKVTMKCGSKTIVKDAEVKAGTDVSKEVKLALGENKLTAEFTPNADYKPGENMEMQSYEKTTVEKTVNCKPYGNPGEKIIVSPEGTQQGEGTAASPLDIKTALAYVQAGQQIICKAGTYELKEALKVERGHNGTKDQRIYLLSDPDDTKPAIFDFCKEGKGITFWGDYWYIKGISVTNTADGQKGIQVAGNNNVLELIKTYENGNTGLQVSGQSIDPYEKWPANNLILNCTSYSNCDAAMEDADGFAAKLTTGPGNVFYGCMAYNNADDGWDCFAKTATGPIGAVTVINSVAFKNGYLADGSEAGNGNGFKMGGSALSGHHVLKNCIAYDNKAKGLDSNSCPDIEVYNCTSYNNKSYNVALYSNSGITTAFKAEGIVSYKDIYTDVLEQIKLSGQSDFDNTKNAFWTEVAAANAPEKKGSTPNEDWFSSLKTGKNPTRNEDGTLDMKGVLELTDKAPAAMGARLNNAEYAMDKILAQFEVTRDIPQAGDLTKAKTSGSSSSVLYMVLLAVFAVVVVVAAVMLNKKNKKA